MITIKEKNENKQIKALLESPEAMEAQRIANIMSPKNATIKAITLFQHTENEKDFQDKLTEKYKGIRLVKLEQIMNECIKFNMYFCNSSKFEGTLSPALINKVVNFCKINNLVVSEDTYRRDIYMMGYMLRSSKDKKGEANLDPKQSDPLIFLRITEKGEDYFVLIDGNKRYNSPLNWFKGIMNFRSLYFLMFTALFSYIILISILNLTVYVGDFIFSPFKMLLFIPCIGIAALVMLFMGYNHDPSEDLKYFNNTFMVHLYTKLVRYITDNQYKEPDPKTLKGVPFISFLSVFLAIFVIYIPFDRYIVNKRLEGVESFTERYTHTQRMNEKEINSLKIKFDPDRKYYRNNSILVKYTPGRIFPIRSKTIDHTSYSSKPKDD